MESQLARASHGDDRECRRATWLRRGQLELVEHRVPQSTRASPACSATPPIPPAMLRVHKLVAHRVSGVRCTALAFPGVVVGWVASARTRPTAAMAVATSIVDGVTQGGAPSARPHPPSPQRVPLAAGGWRQGVCGPRRAPPPGHWWTAGRRLSGDGPGGDPLRAGRRYVMPRAGNAVSGASSWLPARRRRCPPCCSPPYAGAPCVRCPPARPWCTPRSADVRWTGPNCAPRHPQFWKFAEISNLAHIL